MLNKYSKTGKQSRRKTGRISKSVSNTIGAGQIQLHYNQTGRAIADEVKESAAAGTGSAQCRSTSERMGKFGPRANICFPNESFILDGDDRAHLYEFRKGLVLSARQSELTVDITGFADSRGNPGYNKILSERRALEVANYLNNVMPWTPNSVHIYYSGEGEIGPDEEGLKGDQLNDYRIVKANIRDYQRGEPAEIACSNIKKWLNAGIFHHAWGDGKIEHGEALLGLLRIVTRNPKMIPGSGYNDFLPDDLLISTDHFNNFDKEWDKKKYFEEGGKYHTCNHLNAYFAVDDWVKLARKFLLRNERYHGSWREILCQKASYWGKRNGLPDLPKARKSLIYFLENKILPVRTEARRRARSVDHQCELMEDYLIVNNIIAELQESNGSVYNSLLSIP